MSITFSFSELDTYRQCPLKHYLSYVEHWRKEDQLSPALARGALFHEIMDLHYRALQGVQQGGDLSMYNDSNTRISALLWDENASEQTGIQELAEWMYEGYCERYGEEENSGWRIVEVEKRFEHAMGTSEGGLGIKLAGTIDLLVEDKHKRLWIVDHKTCWLLPMQLELDFHDQMALYMYLLRMGEDLDVRGVIYNAVRTQKLQRRMDMDERFSRTLVVRTDRELQAIAQEALVTIGEAYENIERGRIVRRPNPDTCRWRCPYTEPCLAGRKGVNIQGMLADMDFKREETKPGPTFNRVGEPIR